jgi:hypothetical protein
MLDNAFAVFTHVTTTNDYDLLKDLLFKVAECNKSFIEPLKRAHILTYKDHEQYEHSSIFVEKHLLHSGDQRYEDLYGTVSTTLLLLSKDNTAYFYERVYDHSHAREPSLRDFEVANLLLTFDNQALKDARCLHQAMRDGSHARNAVFPQQHNRVLTNHGYESMSSISSNSSGSGSNGSDLGRRQQTIDRP